MSYLRKLFYKSDLTKYESYDIFDDSHAQYLSADDASMLINRMVNKAYQTEIGREDIRELLTKLEDQI